MEDAWNAAEGLFDKGASINDKLKRFTDKIGKGGGGGAGDLTTPQGRSGFFQAVRKDTMEGMQKAIENANRQVNSFQKKTADNTEKTAESASRTSR